MQNRFGLLDMDMMPIFMIIALDIVITLRFSINCLAVCSPTVLFSILREASSETYGPGSLFHHIKSLFHHIKSLFHHISSLFRRLVYNLLFCNLLLSDL